jgi:hypothetical protein
MKSKGIIAFLALFMAAGVLPAAVEKASFQAAKGKALELRRSLIGYAAPQVKAKIAASAQAAKDYLAKCGRECDLGKFTSKDLKARLAGLKDNELRLLQALVFAETVGDDSQLDSIELQDKMQKQQQFIQTISNIMKSQHDTLKAIIQNLRG